MTTLRARFQTIRRGNERHILARRVPHGLLSPAYLWSTDPRVRLHRHFWWRGGPPLPRPLWLGLEIGLWLRWVVFHALPATWRVTRRHGAPIARMEGISRFRLAARLARLAVYWCIPPGQCLLLGAYRNPDSALNFVYDHESRGYHDWRNDSLGPGAGDTQRLRNKAVLAAALQRIHIPTVPTLALVSTEEQAGDALRDGLARNTPMFCKLNEGNQGWGAFSAWPQGKDHAGRMLSGQALANATAISDALLALLRRGDVLIQPCLANHGDLSFSNTDDALTVRLITKRENSSPNTIRLWWAALEVPVEDRPESRDTLMFSITLLSGHVSHRIAHDTGHSHTPAIAELIKRVEAYVEDGRALPHWQPMVTFSLRAHEQFPALESIAWDWVITDTEPLLLEGNSHWRLIYPQKSLGGLLDSLQR
ncbi:MAG: sugar-transfer associated ATP-grasp domain-containing protein [Gammaproteobacteria bacterium]